MEERREVRLEEINKEKLTIEAYNFIKLEKRKIQKMTEIYIKNVSNLLKIYLRKSMEVYLMPEVLIPITDEFFEDNMEKRIEELNKKWEKQLVYNGRKFDQGLKSKKFSDEENEIIRKEIYRYYSVYIHRTKKTFRIFLTYF